jgi:serine/threonine-protein kinase
MTSMRECPECRRAIEDAARFCPHCGAAATGEAPDPWTGRVVNGKFRVEALVGQGGMGRVYRARHLTLDRPVVLKMLHAAYSSDPQVVQRFQREARAASRLDHPNSIAVLDFGEAEDGTLFMAMEYLAGRDLARIVAEEFPLGEARIVRIGEQILSALAEAHAQGIIHRDLKPENVMVEPRRGERDFVKVLDFGIAKITAPGSNEPKLTQAGLVCGTPEYMSPEQARGAELDARTDLYSTGVILYQMLTGELPFSSDTPVGFLTKHLSELPVPPRLRRPDLDISPALDAVVARSLEKDASRRYQTADEMREALLACASKGAEAHAPSAAAGSTAPVKRAQARSSHGALWGVLTAAVVVAAGAGYAAMKRGVFDSWNAAAPGSTRAPEPGRRSTATTTPTASSTTTRTANATPTTPRKKVASASGKRDRSRALALLRRAEARRADQDVNGAIRLYLEAEDAAPDLAEIQKKLALCYQLKGDTRRAAERYRRYLDTDPDDAERVRAILSTLR